MADAVDRQTTSALLYLDGVTVSFDGFKALNELSFVIEPGEMRAIIGPNGAGKTTMMDVVTGKTRADEGDVFFQEGTYDLSKLDETQIAELGIGRKFQKPTVFDMHTVEDNLLLALKNDRRVRATLLWENSAPQEARIDGILDTIRLKALRARVAGSLSHGQKQWLEIGMLLAQEPKLLLVDEPVAGMTDAETKQTAELLKEINKTKTVVVVEHDMAFRARARRQGDVPARRLGAGGRHHRPGVGERARGGSVSGAVTMLEVTNIDLHYGAAQALRGISLKAEPGKVTCVLGRNGVGKTSLLRALIGQHAVSAGSISFDGADITKLSTVERARRGIAYVPQGREIFPLLTVEENLETGFAPLPRDKRDVPDDVFSLFPVLSSMLQRRGGDLSGGQQQQLAIGRALVMRPKLLLLDEPTEGIQPSIIKDIGRAIVLSARPEGNGDHSGRAISRFRAGTRRRSGGDGPRRDRLFLRPREHGRRRAQARAGDLIGRGLDFCVGGGGEQRVSGGCRA